MKLILTVYTVFVLLYIIYQLFTIVLFSMKVVRNNAKVLVDFAYAIAIVLFNAIYFLLLVDGINNVLINIELLENDSLPFVIFTLPIMVIISSTMINEGMFAYSETKLYSKDRAWDMDKVAVVFVSKNRITRRAKMQLEVGGSRSPQPKRVLVRTSIAKLEVFMENKKLYSD